MAKILIMDDEAGLRNVVFNMLRPLGQTLFTAEDGNQAIEIAKREMPDVALLDMRVPDMDGLEVLAALKKINPPIKCIMLSGFGDVETAVNAIKLGAFDYLSKPFKIDEVLRVVNKALHGEGPAAAPSAVTPAAPKVDEVVPAPVAVPAKKGVPLAVTIGAIGVAVLLLGVVLFKFFLSGNGGKEYTIPYTNATGIAWVKGNLWISDWVSGNIYQHRGDGTLSIGAVYKTTNLQPTGIAYDGEYLWSCSSSERRIYKHALDATLAVQAIFALPDVNPAALYFDGANLWVIDSDNAKIYKHKMDQTLSVLGAYDSPAINPCGMFKKDEFIYIGDYKTGKIYQTSSADLSVREVYGLPEFRDGKFKMASLCWDGTSIWVSTDGLGKIYQYSFNDLKLIKF